MEITFKTKSGNEFTGTLNKTRGNASITVLGDKFFMTKEGLKQIKAENFCKASGIATCDVLLQLSEQEYKRVFGIMFPEKVKVKFVSKFEHCDAGISGETFTKGSIWIMGDGSEKFFETHRHEA